VSNESPISRTGWASFPENPHVALQEVSKILGLSENELDLLLALLGKADDGYLQFHQGNISIDFFNRSLDEKEIILEVEVEKEKTTSSVKYSLSAGDNCGLSGDTE